MAGEGFDIISVDDDDDIVIQAGAVPHDRPVPQPAQGEPQAAGDPEPEPAEDAAPAADAPEGVDAETAALLAGASPEDRAAFERHLRAKQAREQQAMITQEDDLSQSGPFTRMRFAVLGVMLALLVGFLIYFYLRFVA